MVNQRAKVELIGKEQHPVVVVDDFWPQPQQLLDYALHHGEVRSDGGLYPGLRSPAPAMFGQQIRQQLATVMEQVFAIPLSAIQQIDSYYSLVTTPAQQLQLLQRIPHYDRPHPQDLAVIYYLCDDRHGGTSFYRHKSTGYEAIVPQRQHHYQQQLANDFRRFGHPAGYIHGDTAIFERIATVPARFNRLVMYRCSSLHSGDIAADYQYDSNPLTGRFTIAAFLSSQLR